MAKYKTQKPSKKTKSQPMISDSDEDSDEHTHNEMLTGSDSSDDVVDDVLPTHARRQPAKDIAALAAAAQQQAAAFAARHKKHTAAAAAAAAGQPTSVGEGSEEEDEMNSSDAEQDEEQEEDEGPTAAQRPHIYDADGMHEKLEDVAWIEEQPWRESLVITSAQPTHVEDVDDDLERELAFYNQALSATTEAISRFQGEDVAWLRPPDYYAEMVKSDEQMARIKDRLMHEQQQIDQATERRKAREQKAYAKQVQAEKQKERAQEKKRQIQQVQQLRKQREKSGFAGELDFDAEMNKQAGRSGGQQQQPRNGMRPGQRFNPNDRTPNKKRQLKNAKFGFGGKKRLQKQNDAFSAADMSGYKPGRSGSGASKQGGKGAWGRAGRPQGGVQKKKKGGVTRPGKARRQQQRQRKV